MSASACPEDAYAAAVAVGIDYGSRHRAWDDEWGEGVPVLQAVSWLPRAEGSIRLGFERRAGGTALATLHQSGCARVRFPKVEGGACPEAVLLNTAGGVTGGDALDVRISLAAGAAATVATAAAEKVYRSRDGVAAIRVGLDLASGARLGWLPQPTILFDRARLDRRTEVSLAAGASLLAVECLLFGRAAMGEDMRGGYIRDVWRVRRAGTLVFADTFLADGRVADILDRKATLDRARASAMLLYAAPDAPTRLEAVRAILAEADCEGGASLVGDLLVVRALAPGGQPLLAMLARAIEALSGARVPRVWQC